MGNQQKSSHQNANWTVQNVLDQNYQQQQQNNFAKQIVNQNKKRCCERQPSIINSLNNLQRDGNKKKSCKIKHAPVQNKQNLISGHHIQNVFDNTNDKNLQNVKSQNQIYSIGNLSTCNELQQNNAIVNNKSKMVIEQVQHEDNEKEKKQIKTSLPPLKKIRASKARLL